MGRAKAVGRRAGRADAAAQKAHRWMLHALPIKQAWPGGLHARNPGRMVKSESEGEDVRRTWVNALLENSFCSSPVTRHPSPVTHHSSLFKYTLFSAC